MQLHIKFLEGTERESVYRFSPEQSPVTIGRSDKCTIQVSNPNLSRYQCQFIINDRNEWTLRDGRNDNPSSNGTWIYVGGGRAIENGTNIKVGDTLFVAKLDHVNIP